MPAQLHRSRKKERQKERKKATKSGDLVTRGQKEAATAPMKKNMNTT